jgi:molecular chaperone GrpE
MMKKHKKTEKAEEKNVNEDVQNAAEDKKADNDLQTPKPEPCKDIGTCGDIEKLREEYRQLDEKFRRLSADYANYQKRVPRQIEESIAYKVESFVKSLLPGIDNFDHALAHADKSDKESMVKGVEMVYENLLSILKSNGLEQIDAAGETFDHNCHQAVMQRAEEDKENGIVLEQYQKGYKYNGRVLRPAMVVVNKLPEEQSEAQENSAEQDDTQQDTSKE